VKQTDQLATTAKAERAEATGDRLREIGVVELPLIPFFYRERLLRSRQQSGVQRYALMAKRSCIAHEQCTAIAALSERKGLRGVPRDLGVSHETVRAICKRVRQDAVSTEDVPARLVIALRR
jgi:hypothetical protein